MLERYVRALTASSSFSHSQAYGIVYVVDSSSPDRFSEAADALRGVMSHDRVEGKPLLVLANKQDLNDACNEAQLTTAMALGEMIPEEKLQVVSEFNYSYATTAV